MKQVFIPEMQAVVDIYGTVVHDGDIFFIFWNRFLRQPRFDTLPIEDCVEYNGEILPDVKDDAKNPISLIHSDERYEPGMCDECQMRFQCFPQLFKPENGVGPLSTDEIKDLLKGTLVDPPKPNDPGTTEKP